VKICCIGDSVTFGQNVRASEAWPAVLERLTGHDVRNVGVCGDTTRLGLERFPRDVQLHKPDVVCIQFGANDCNAWDSDNGLPRVSGAAYRANIEEMRQRAITIGARPIVLRPHEAPGKTLDYNLRLCAYCHDAALDPPKLSVLDDGYGIHPDPAMHERYAELVASAL
jgi:lysophospholipase L1-like esterase